MIRLALDSNILIYGLGVNRSKSDAAKIAKVIELVPRLSIESHSFVSTQAMGECYNVAVKAGLPREAVQASIMGFARYFQHSTPSFDDFVSAVELASKHKLQIWDALILSNAASNRCTYLLSEDMQDGFVWRDVTVLNPLIGEVERTLFG